MQIWAVVNQKGGVGKTTTTLALGQGLALSGRRVLLIDLDPHGSLTRSFGVPDLPAPQGVMELFSTPPVALVDLARPSPIAGLDFVCAQAALATLERRSANAPGLGLALQKALRDPDLGYDHVLMDCAPQLGLLMINALAAADLVVIPTQTEPLAMHGLQGMLRTVEMVGKSRKRLLPHVILPTLHDRRTRIGTETLLDMQRLYGRSVWEDAIPVDTRLSNTSELTQPPVSDAYPGRGIAAYRRALRWMLSKEYAACEVAS